MTARLSALSVTTLVKRACVVWEREISKLCRKAVKQLLLDKSLKHIEINGDNLHDFLGVQRYDYGPCG